MLSFCTKTLLVDVETNEQYSVIFNQNVDLHSLSGSLQPRMLPFWTKLLTCLKNQPTLIRNKHPPPKKNFLESTQLYFRFYSIYSSVSFYLLVDCMTVHNNFNFTGHKQRCCIIRGIKHCLL